MIMKSCPDHPNSNSMSMCKSIVPLSCLILSLAAQNAGAQQYWDNNGTATPTNGVWDTTTANWAGSSTPTTSTSPYADGSFAYFSAGTTNIASLAITVNSPVVCTGMATGFGGAIVVTNTTFSGTGSIEIADTLQNFNCDSGNFIFNVPLIGDGGITQHGTGSITFSANNTYAGGTELTGGQVINYNNNDAFGTGPIYVDGYGNALVNQSNGIIAVTMTNDFTFYLPEALNLAGGNPVASAPGTTFTGAFTLYSGGTCTLETSSTATEKDEITGIISGPQASLAISDAGIMILAGSNTYTGTTTLAGGTIQVASPENPGNYGPFGVPDNSANSIVMTGGTLQFSSSNQFDYSSRLSSQSTAYSIDVNGQTVTFASTIYGGSLTNMSSVAGGTLILSGANYYNGPTVLKSGILNVYAMPDGGNSAIGYGSVVLGGGTLLYTGTGDSTARSFAGTSGTTSTIDVPNGVTLTLGGQITGTAAFYVNKVDTGTLVIGSSLNNAYCGVNIQGGTLILNQTGAGNAIGGATTVASNAMLQLAANGYNSNIYNGSTTPLTVSNGGVFDLNGQNNAIYSLSIAGNGINGGGALINSASGTTSTLTVPMTIASNLTIGGAGSITLPGVISSFDTTPTSLTYAGAGTLMLGGVNTYLGGTFVNSGTLDASMAGSLPGNVTVNAGSMLELDSANAMTPAATLNLASSLSTGAVYLNFSGAQSILALNIGGVAMAPGTYGLGGNNPNGMFSGAGTLVIASESVYWNPGSSHSLPGSGGNGAWDNTVSSDWFNGSANGDWFAGNLATFAGTAGTVALNDNVTVNGISFTTPGYTINGGDTLTLGGSSPIIAVTNGTTTINSVIAGGGTNTGLTVSGSGTLALNGANTYAGNVIVNGATLNVNSVADSTANALGIGVNPGVITNGVTLTGGATLSYVGSGTGTTVRNITNSGTTSTYLNVATGSILNLTGSVKEASDNAVPSVTKTGTGTLYLGGVSNDNSGLTMAVNAGEVVITKTSYASAHGLGGGASSVGSGAELQLAGSGSYDLYSTCLLTVANGGLLDVNGQNDSFGTLTLSGTGNSYDANGGALINSAAGTTALLTNGTSAVVLAGPTTIGGSGSIELFSVVSGSGQSLTYSGTGTLTLNSANTFTGGSTINGGGTVQINNAAGLGTGTITMNGNGVLIPNIVTGTLANTVVGGPSNIINIKETTGDNLTLGGNMSAFTGTVNCPTSPGGNAKAQILSAAVNLSSAATLNIAAGGTFYTANPGVIIPCPVNVYGTGNAETYGALRMENGAVVSGPVILYGNTTMGNGQSGPTKLATISGGISQSNGVYGITFTAEPGTMVLSGTNTYTGPTTISGGVLEIAGNGLLGGGNYAANITNNATVIYASSNTQTLSGVISGNGTLTQNGPGSLTLSGTNTYTNYTLINGGTLAVGGSGCLGVTASATNYAPGITNNGTFNYASSAAQTLSGVLSGTGALTQSGSGSLTLTVANTYAGGTAISAGTLALSGSGSINNTASISIGAGATFDVSAYPSYSIPGSATSFAASGSATAAATIKAASGAGTVTLALPVTLTFTPQTFNGDVSHPALYVSQISSGELVLGGSSIIINNAGSKPLGGGTYSLVQVAPGGAISLGNPAVTIGGAGLGASCTASLSVSGGSLNLVVVSTAPPVPVVNSVTHSGNNLVFSGTNGQAGGDYYVLTSTNLALPLSKWTNVATNAFSATGTFSVTNAVSGSPSYFIIATP